MQSAGPENLLIRHDGNSMFAREINGANTVVPVLVTNQHCREFGRRDSLRAKMLYQYRKAESCLKQEGRFVCSQNKRIA